MEEDNDFSKIGKHERWLTEKGTKCLGLLENMSKLV